MQELSLSATEDTDLPPIAACRSLRSLDLKIGQRSARGVDLAFVRDLRQLTSLCLVTQDVVDLTPLAALSLERLAPAAGPAAAQARVTSSSVRSMRIHAAVYR